MICTYIMFLFVFIAINVLPGFCRFPIEALSIPGVTNGGGKMRIRAGTMFMLLRRFTWEFCFGTKRLFEMLAFLVWFIVAGPELLFRC